MTFDPFGDFDKRGYLRNVARTKDPKIVRQMEHSSFTTGLDAAFAKLAAQKRLSYDDVLATHKILFEAVYPWAGEDRLTNAPRLVVSKGNDKKRSCSHTRRIFGARSITHSTMGRKESLWPPSPAKLWAISPMGIRSSTAMAVPSWSYTAFSRNGPGFSIDWASTNKNDYLAALTQELEAPGKRHLDTYLEPFIRSGVSHSGLAANVSAAPGLDGEGEDVVLGDTEDPELKAQYHAQELKRKETQK